MEKRLNGGFDLNGSGLEEGPTNFEKEIPAHTFARLNGSTAMDEHGLGHHYGKMPNGGIKAEPMGHDYNAEVAVNNEQYYNGSLEDKVR